MFKFIHKLLPHKHDWQYYMTKELRDPHLKGTARYCLKCKKWEYCASNDTVYLACLKPRVVIGVLYVKV